MQIRNAEPLAGSAERLVARAAAVCSDMALAPPDLVPTVVRATLLDDTHRPYRPSVPASGGTRRQTTGKTAEVDGATTVLEAGEEAGVGMPYGCRMGICHTCTLTLVSGTVRDLRNGDEFSQPNEQVQTCVTVPVGDCTLDI